MLFGLCCICGFRGGFCRFRGIASCVGIVGRSKLVPGAAVVPSAHLFPAFLHIIVDPRKDHVPGKRVPKTAAPTAPLAVFMTAAGVVIRQRHGFKDEKSAHKAHAGKQLFPEVHSSHLVRLQRRIHFFQPIDSISYFLIARSTVSRALLQCTDHSHCFSTSFSLFKSSGLAICSFMPVFFASCTSSAKAFAVMAMMGTLPRLPASARIAAVAS